MYKILFFILIGVLFSTAVWIAWSVYVNRSQKFIILRLIQNTLENFLSQMGYLSRNALSNSFSKAISLMKMVFRSGNKSRYSLPWYVVLGPEKCGKTTLLENSKMNFAMGFPQKSFPDDRSTPCLWNFFEYGITLELDGQCFLKETGVGADEISWKNFKNLLVAQHPNRPLDGVVLTFSCGEFLNETRENLVARATYMHSKLLELQDTTGIRFPVYFIITQSDRLKGFSDFCRELPQGNQQDIFGWSSPYSIDVVFESNWSEDMFSMLNGQIERIQHEIFLNGSMQVDPEGLMLFPVSFSKIQKKLDSVLNVLFNVNPLKEDFFLRGVYFCGDSQAKNDDEKEELVSNFTPSLSRKGPVPIPSLQESLQRVPSFLTQTISDDGVSSLRRNIFFINKVLKDKIFAERGMACLTRNKFRTNSKALQILKYFVGGGLTLGSGGLFYSYDNLTRVTQHMSPHLERVERVIHRAAIGDNKNSLNRLFFGQRIDVLSKISSDLNLDALKSLFIPFSWRNKIGSQIEKILIFFYDRTVLSILPAKLSERLTLLTTGKLRLDSGEMPAFKSLNPLATPEFQALSAYVQELHTLEDVANTLNALKVSQKMSDLSFVTKELFQQEIPVKLLSHQKIYKNSLDYSHLDEINFKVFEKQSTDYLFFLYGKFLEVLMDPERLCPEIKALQEEIHSFGSGGRTYRPEQLQRLVKKIGHVMRIMSDPIAQWMSKSSLDLGPQFDEVIKRISSSLFINASTVETMIERGNKAFQTFKGLMVTYRTPLSGSLFTLQGSSVMPSESLVRLQGALNLLFSEAFMAPHTTLQIQTHLPKGSVLLWNINPLSDAAVMIRSFRKFMESKLSIFPKATWDVLTALCRRSLQYNSQNLISKAQNFVAKQKGTSALSTEEAFVPEIQNLRSSLVLLNQLVDGLKDMGALHAYNDLKTILYTQCLKLLAKIDTLLESDGLYRIRPDRLREWQGEGNAALSLCDVQSADELKKFLESQRDRVRYLSKEFAEPVVTLLEKTSPKETSGKPVLLLKWQNILKQLGTYGRYGHHNTLVKLEKFLQEDLMKSDTFFLWFSASKPSQNSNAARDFFASRLISIKNDLAARYDRLMNEKFIKEYGRISHYFNQNVSGRFPFSEDLNAPEVDRVHVRKLYRLIGAQKNLFPEFYKRKNDLTPLLKGMVSFLESLDKVHPLFSPFIYNENSEKLVFNVKFRPYKSGELFGNHIVRWGSDEAQGQGPCPDSVKGDWKTWEQPLSMTFKWASSSPFEPIPLQQSSYAYKLDIKPQQVDLIFRGPLALLRCVAHYGEAWKNTSSSKLLRFSYQVKERARVTTQNNTLFPAKIQTAFWSMVLEIYRRTPEGDVPLVWGGFPIVAPLEEFYTFNKLLEEFSDAH